MAKKTAKKSTATKTTKAIPASKTKTKSPASKKSAIDVLLTKGPKLGEKVPDFSLPSTRGQEFSLSDLKGKKVVLYFYPKDATPGCTIQGNEFSKLSKEFQKNKTEVFGISRDSLKSHENFKSKQGFQIDLLSDEKEEACGLFDVIHEKNMYGRKVMGVVRSTFLIGEDGKLLKEWRKVKAEGHAAEVLQTIKELG
jgi:thioredoxin-dependent peroxiredoxin